MEEAAVVRPRTHYQQHLQASRPHSSYGGGARLMRESSGEAASSSDDELLAGETHFEARVGVLCRKKSSKGVQFEQEPAERILQLQGDQLKLKKKDKMKAKIFIYYVWVRRNISDYVPKDSHRLKDENLAVLAGWYTDLMIVTFPTSGAKETFLQEFQRVNQETLRSLYGEHKDLSEQCLVSLGACIGNSSGAVATAAAEEPSLTLPVQPYETANDVARKFKAAFKLDASLRAVLWLEGPASHVMVGCESIFAAVLYLIHERHKSSSSANRRRGSVLSEASSNSPNESNSMDLDESTTARGEPAVRLSLHLQDTCSSGSCATRKKKSHTPLQLRRSSEVPSKIRSWLASNRKSQLIRHGSVEALGSSTSNLGVASEPQSAIIGRPLAELYPSGIVSRPVTCLLAQIYHRCCHTRGIFRQPGSVSEKNQLLHALSHYDLAKADNMPQLNQFGEHCIADALKHYLRNLPGCLLQKSLANQWTRVASDLGGDAAISAVRSVIQQMHPQNAHLLHMLMITLRRVADFQEQNQMTPGNIGVTVSFSVLDLDHPENRLDVMEQEAQRVNKLIEMMIANYARIWPNEVENIRVRNDFVSHIHLVDDMSSMESLIGENGGARHPDACEPLSLSSISKDSGLQLSDQQLDDTRMPSSKAVNPTVKVVIDIPERSQPPPYEIALKRQARSHQRTPRNQAPAVPVLAPQPDVPSTPPRRERPPVPARLHRRPASLGPSNRQPLPGDATPAAAATTAAAAPAATIAAEPVESKARHPLSDGRVPLMQQQHQQQQGAAPPSMPPPTHSQATSASRPVRGAFVPAAAAAAAAAAAYSAAQQQPRFRKRSSSETRLDLIGIQAQPTPAPVVPAAVGPAHSQTHQLQPQQAADPAAVARRRDFERFTRLHVSRDCLDSPRAAAATAGSVAVGATAGVPFASRHAPIRGGNGSSVDFSINSGHATVRHQARPRTRLPEALQRKLADQPESLV